MEDIANDTNSEWKGSRLEPNKGTKRKPKGEQNASTNPHRNKNTPLQLKNEGFERHLVDDDR